MEAHIPLCSSLNTVQHRHGGIHESTTPFAMPPFSRKMQAVFSVLYSQAIMKLLVKVYVAAQKHDRAIVKLVICFSENCYHLCNFLSQHN